MPFTQTDIDALKSAIALGAREVRYADGRTVTYRSMTEMQSALQMMQNDLVGPRSLSQDRVTTGYVSNTSRGTPVFGPGSCDGGDGGWQW